MDEVARCVLAVSETGLIGRIARGGRVGRAPVQAERPVHEGVLAGQLARKELAHEPFRIVVAQDRPARVEVRPDPRTGLLGRAADVQVGPLDLVVQTRKREAAEKIQLHIVLGRVIGVARRSHDAGARELAFLLEARTGPPAVVVAGRNDYAQGADRCLVGESARGFQPDVDRDFLDLQQTQRCVDQRLTDGAQLGVGIVRPRLDLAARVEGQGQRARNIACIVVEAEEVGAAAVVDQAFLGRRLGVAAQ